MKKNSGLTLLELIISIMILSIMSGVLYNFFLKGIDLLDFTDKEIQTSLTTSGVLNRINSDWSFSETLHYSDTHSLFFSAYLNNDTSLTEIRYLFKEPELFIFNSKYNDTGSIKNLTDVSFTLFNENGTDTLLQVSVVKNNKKLSGKFVSLND
jgi:prepilin-type N-terminal cleavage/methylation domain-containing protein